MSDNMKAVVKTKREKGAELLTIPIPKPAPNEVLVKVKATSICGTDVHIYNWDGWAEGRIQNVPQTLGHEFSGEVVEVGSRVKRVKVGDFISAETHIPCGHCPQCLTGQMHICNELKILGVDINGCFAEYAVIPEIVCWKNDPSIPFEYASIQEPLGNAVYATLEGGGINGHTVAIFGDGPTGLFATGVARPRAQGQDITKTAIPILKANSKDCPKTSQIHAETIAIKITIGTNTEDTLSAILAIGALEFPASSTSLII